MDYRDNNNDMYGGQYCSRPSVNDALFGGIGTDDAYHISPSQTSYSSYNKSNSTDWGKIAIIALVLVILGGVGFYFYNSTIKYNGTYTLEEIGYQGFTMSVDQLEAMSGTTMEGTIIIKGKNATLDVTDQSGNVSGDCKVKIEGSKLTFENDGRTLEGTYDDDEKTITLNFMGADFIFKKK